MTGNRRPRARYADDKLVDRAAELAKKHGVALELGPDGSVKILGKLDSAPPGGLGSGEEGKTADDALEAWEQGRGPTTRRS